MFNEPQPVVTKQGHWWLF